MGNATVRKLLPTAPPWRRRQAVSPPSPAPPPTGVMRVGGAEVDLAEGRVRAPDGTVTELRRQSADVLRHLAAHPGRTVPKSELLDAVWGDIAVTEDSLVQCVADIRRALGAARDRLHTAHRSGYRLDLDTAAPRARAPLRLAAAFAVAALVALAIWQLRDRPVTGSPHPVVAVLPFENLAGDDRWDRLARGVTEEVIADLATNPWLFVLADATTRPHAGQTPQAVAAALGAGHVVTGTLQADDGRVRITAALADPANGRQVWARQWEGPADDLLRLQTAAAEALVGALSARWSGAIARTDRAAARGAGTDSLAAYELYLLGIEHKHRFTLADYDLAEGYLQRAVGIDPDFAQAWAALALVQGLRGDFASDGQDLEGLHLRRYQYIQRALAADPDDPAVLIEVSWLQSLIGEPQAAERAIRRAVALAPNDADILAHAAYAGTTRAPLGSDAVAWAERALALNPAAPDWYRTGLGVAAFAAGDYTRAADALRQVSPQEPVQCLFLAAAEGMRGNPGPARAAAADLGRLIPELDLDWYMDGWPKEPGLRARLLDGALRAGLGATPVASGE